MHKTAATRSASAWRNLLTRWADRYQLTVELSETAKLALPMVLTQIGQIAMMTTDVAFIGRIGAEALAGTALAGRIYLVSFMFGIGLLAPIIPLTAQAFAANDLAVVRKSLRMGLWMALLLSLPSIALALSGEQILLDFGEAPQTARLAREYLFGLAWGVAPTLCFQAIRSFMGAVKRPEPVLWITLGAIPANAVLVYLLMYGKLGLPPLELFGAGLATSLVNCGTFLAGLWFITMRRPFRDYRVLAHFWRFDWPIMRQLIVIGTPLSIASLIGCGWISATVVLAGLISTSALAAHQIALQVATIMFMISFAISMASAVRVGHAVGRNDSSGIKQAGLAAMLLGLGIVAILTLAVISARFEIAQLFLFDALGNGDATIGLAAKLLAVGAWFFVSDTVENIATGGLRGLRDTRVPLVFAGISYWLIGFSLSYLLGLKVGLGAIGIWIGLSLGKTVYAALLVVRFQTLANRFSSQAVGTTEPRGKPPFIWSEP